MSNCQTIDGLSNSADFLQQSLPGIPLKILKDRYSEVLIDFSQKTEIWRYVFERLSVYKDTKLYDLKKEEGQDIHRIVDVFVSDGCGCEREYKIPEGKGIQTGRYGGSSINDHSHHSNYHGLQSRRDGSHQSYNNRDQWWYSPEPNKIMFNECFCDDGCLRLELVLRPERGTTNFPPALLDKYKESIEFGVLAKAMMMPNQQWSDIKFAQYYKEQYDQAIIVTKREYKNNMLSGRPAYAHGSNGGRRT